MPLNDNDLLLINDSQDSNEAKKITYGTLKSNIHGDSGNDLQAVTDNGNTTTNGISIKSDLTPLEVTRNTTTTNNALMQWRSDNGGTDVPQAKCLADGTFFIGGNVIGNDPNIKLNADGSANFDGVVYSGGNAFNGQADGSRLSPGGNIYASAASGTLWGGYTTGSNAFTSQISADGSANFKKRVSVSQDDAAASLFRGSLSGTETFQVTANGSASFASNVDIDSYVQISRDNATKSALIGRTGTTKTSTIWADGSVTLGGTIRDTFTNSGSTIRLDAGAGSAEFTGSVTSGPAWNRTLNHDTTWIPNGEIYLQRSSGNGSSPLLRGHLSSTDGSNSTITSEIKANGIALFATGRTGVVTSEGNMEIYRANPLDNAQLLQLFSDFGGTKVSKVSIKGDGSANFVGTVTAPGLFFNLEPDNEANYTVTTSTDEEGNEVETRVYNGPTLDVKAVVQELQQRVADRDAVITDLTTRIAALEADHQTLMNNNNGGY